MNIVEQKDTVETQDELRGAFVADVYSRFNETKEDVTERNEHIKERDDFIYGKAINRALDIPIGHDFTPVNWLHRTVEIHKNMVMGRGFTVSSTYNTNDLSEGQGEQERQQMQADNKKNKALAERRMDTIKSIILDNGGDALFANMGEGASAVGLACLKMYWDESDKKVAIKNIEAVENLYVLWSSDDFREAEAYGYVYQVSKRYAINELGAPQDVATSKKGNPLEFLETEDLALGQPMVTVLEVTGIVEGWSYENGKVKRVEVGKEKEINATIIGKTITEITSNSKAIPRYYLFQNKRERRRPWGRSDISDAAIQLNLTYIETLSDWRTVAAKVNFPKYKGIGFGDDVQMPKFEPRKSQILPMSEEQDILELTQGDANGLDWGRQLEEIKEQYVRESAVSRALFDDPSVTLNSNQALITSMKTTTDIAEAKKQLWTPILRELFSDALEMAADHIDGINELVDDDNWDIKIMWPSVMQKDDPQYQTMLLNRFNAGLLSPQSYLEALGENKEELDRIREAATDPIQAGIMGHQLPMLAQALINAATADIQAWYALSQPQPPQQAGNTPGVNSNGGNAAPGQIATESQSTPGSQPMSQPGTGATGASAQGAIAQTQQNNGQ